MSAQYTTVCTTNCAADIRTEWSTKLAAERATIITAKRSTFYAAVGATQCATK